MIIYSTILCSNNLYMIDDLCMYSSNQTQAIYLTCREFFGHRLLLQYLDLSMDLRIAIYMLPPRMGQDELDAVIFFVEAAHRFVSYWPKCVYV